MDNLSLIGETRNDFKVDFEGCSLDYERAEFNNATVHCFFANIPSEKVLRASWILISNFVAVKFQNKLEDEFERWNIYLFYRIENKIGRDLHYLIENDTFSSRKIVVDNIQSTKNIINEHVLNTDMTINSSPILNDDEFTYNIVVQESLKDIKVKKRLGQEIEDSLEEIIKIIKNNSNEA